MNPIQMIRFTTEVTTSVTLVVAQLLILVVFEIGMLVFRAVSQKP